MRRNRILIIFALVCAMGTAVLWLGTVMADATVEVNEGLTVAEGSTGNIISNTLLLATDGDMGANNAILTYTLVTTPTNGDLFLNTTLLTPTGTFLQTDIDSNLLTYTHDGSETLSDGFDFTAATSTTITSTNFLITVTAVNEAPTISGGPFSVPENAANGTFVGTVITSDVDAGDTFAYTILSSDPAAAFAIGSSSGDITVSDSNLLNFETTPTFTLTVEVEDSGFLTDSAEIVINLLDENDAPVLMPAGPFSIPENPPDTTPVGTPLVASDEDIGAGDILTFTITSGNAGGAFGISPNSGQLTVVNGSLLDFDVPPNSYNLTVRVTDSAGAFDSEIVAVNLTDVNEPPTVSNSTFTPSENSANGSSVGFVNADDPEDDTLHYDIDSGNTNAAFALNPSSGEITVNDVNQLDFETTPTFTLMVSVDDLVNPDVVATITINLQDQNEAPLIDMTTLSVTENSSNGTTVGTVPAVDPDIADVAQLSFDILSGNTGSAFAIANDGNNNAVITIADSSALDYETTQSFMLSVIVTDTMNATNTANVTINVNNLFDEAPTVSDASFFVAQGSTNGVVVGTVSATDPEFVSGDTLTFMIIGGNTGTVFAIDSATGQITVPDTSKLNANAMPTFNLTVQATDKGGKIDTGTITVNVSPLPITYSYMSMALNNFSPVEPNNNCTQAFAIVTGVTHEFTANDTEDWYAVRLSSAGNLNVTLSSFEPAQGQLIVYDANCLTPLQNNGSSSTTKVINLTNLAAGTYYIRVFSAPITNTTYNLRIN